MMTAQPLDQWPKWRDALVFHLRMQDVPGDRIGDILLEADAHLRESGEAPEDAFGDAKHYAASRAEGSARPGNDLLLWLIAVGAFAGSFITVDAAMALGRGETSVFFMPPWIALVAGIALLVAILARIPDDLIRHPATGLPLFRDYPGVRFGLVGIVLVAAVGFFFIGRMIG